MSFSLVKFSQIIKLEYGKALPDSDRDFDGIYAAYGANGEKSRTNKFLYDKPSIIVGRKGSAGELTLVKDKFWALDVTYYLTHDENKTDLMYLYYALKTKNLTSYARGVKPGINRNDVYELEIPLPPLAKQQKIVAKLDAIFAEIDKATAAAEANAKNAEALFQSYLTEVFESDSSGWSERKLSEISRYMGRGKSKHRPRNDESLYGGKYPFIQTGDVRNAKKYITKFSQTYNDKGLAQSKLWEANTVCITIAANIAEIGVLTFEACFPDSVIGVVVDEEKISVDFLYLMLLHEQQLLKSKGKGSAQDNINLATFEDMLFKVPARSEQDKIVEVLNDIQVLTDSIKNSQIKKIKSLESLKQSMLKKAFAGELVKE